VTYDGENRRAVPKYARARETASNPYLRMAIPMVGAGLTAILGWTILDAVERRDDKVEKVVAAVESVQESVGEIQQAVGVLTVQTEGVRQSYDRMIEGRQAVWKRLRQIDTRVTIIEASGGD
jgi:hypothetical protein